MRPLCIAAFGLTFLAFIPASGQDKKPPAPTVEELVADLGHPVYRAREKAQRELWNRGDAAIPALEKALGSDDPEVVRRARELLDKFAWGVRPDTPPEVLKLLKQFQAGDRDPQKSLEVRKAAILELMRFGPAGVSVAKALLGKDLPAEARAQVVTQITALLRREVPLRLFEGKTDVAAELIAMHAAGTGPEGAADYAVFQVLRNNLPTAITSAEAGLKAGRRSANHKLILAHLYRSNSEWEKARKVAADIEQVPGEPRIIEQLREEEGDWATLAEKGYVGQLNHPDAVRLTLLRLAGKQKEFAAEAKEIAKAANEFSSAEEALEAAIALLANHRNDEAVRILTERKQNLGLLGEILIQRLRYKEALALTTDDIERTGRERLELDLRRARILVLTGKRDEAVQLFSKVAEGLVLSEKFADSRSWTTEMRSLLRTEMRVGLKDLAAEHAAQFITTGAFSRNEGSATGESAFEILFYQNATAAETLFNALRARKIPGEEPGPTISRVRDLLTGKAGKAAVDEALKAMREGKDDEVFSTEGRPPASEPRAVNVPSKAFQCRQQLAIAAVCRAAHRDGDALAAYKAAAKLASDSNDLAGARSWVYGVSDAHRPFIEWGDFLYDRSRFREAAEAYLEGWKMFPEQPLPMFLSGKALAKAGDVKEGERRMELSHWVSLGQERIRGRFLDELIARGEGKAARRETELVLRGCWSRDHYFGNVMNQGARASQMIKDYATAEKCTQRSLLVLLKTPGMYYVETSAYMSSPHAMLVYRALAKVADGKADEAIEAARAALAVTPGHVELVSGMVPGLEKLGKKREADELFGIAWKAYQQVLTDFPDSPSARNALAILSANCRRELDKGLKYAQEAVKAEPASLGFRDTLAEVYFRKGDRKKALELMTKLAEEDTRNPLYKRQLARYRDGAFDSPRPNTED